MKVLEKPKIAKRWYALRTKPRAEKQCLAGLTEKGLEVYLPLLKTLRTWSDRKKWVEIPLFNSYIFVKIDKPDFGKALYTPGVLNFIYFEGQPAAIPDKQIEDIKLLLASDLPVETSEEVFEKGDPVRVKSGPMKGLMGELIQFKGTHKVLVRIDHIGHSLIVEIPLNKLVKNQP